MTYRRGWAPAALAMFLSASSLTIGKAMPNLLLPEEAGGGFGACDGGGEGGFEDEGAGAGAGVDVGGLSPAGGLGVLAGGLRGLQRLPSLLLNT